VRRLWQSGLATGDDESLHGRVYTIVDTGTRVHTRHVRLPVCAVVFGVMSPEHRPSPPTPTRLDLSREPTCPECGGRRTVQTFIHFGTTTFFCPDCSNVWDVTKMARDIM
jgi:hypothetical protein